ncbi:glycosyltransferase family 2 protein [Chengkuizengella sediminis]|uniref:glycosyltransferase family 2 protein n=1 Tax=Chengkuizengella sediminis TaxID=1885917 RepID=UPI001389D3C8|nr:glycosyltransferase family 2 protein [Chengkuizengella sediminis]NDI33220.1 glycosyltransferase family 2 protein [Chengkuizengella sediminis]
MEIHLYALCWNEEKMLPYFFKHYDNIVDQYYIYDNYSTDNSISILRSHPKVIMNRFKIQGDSMILSTQHMHNQFWKQSKVDWIITCNMDEHLYHPNLRGYLQDCTYSGITIIESEGYDMVSDSFPNSDQPLYESIKVGVRTPFYDMTNIFNPTEIKDINFSVGRHEANPVGNVKKTIKNEVKLLHYKFLGFDYFNSRLSELKSGLRKTDIAKQWGDHYLWDERKKLQVFESVKKRAVKVL